LRSELIKKKKKTQPATASACVRCFQVICQSCENCGSSCGRDGFFLHKCSTILRSKFITLSPKNLHRLPYFTITTFPLSTLGTNQAVNCLALVYLLCAFGFVDSGIVCVCVCCGDGSGTSCGDRTKNMRHGIGNKARDTHAPFLHFAVY